MIVSLNGYIRTEDVSLFAHTARDSSSYVHVYATKYLKANNKY